MAGVSQRSEIYTSAVNKQETRRNETGFIRSFFSSNKRRNSNYNRYNSSNGVSSNGVSSGINRIDVNNVSQRDPVVYVRPKDLCPKPHRPHLPEPNGPGKFAPLKHGNIPHGQDLGHLFRQYSK